MQRGHVVIAAILLIAPAAIGQPVKPTTPAHTIGPIPVVTAAEVVIYEQKDFAGRSETLTRGDHRIADWKPASIKVPAGLVAILYQSADSAGGYGISVDLMEDHPVLKEFGIEGEVSFITVFSSTRTGRYWARNSMRGGQFVWGHWERNRAAGNPVNKVAIASPPSPSRAPPAPTSLQRQGATWTITTLGPQSGAEAARWRSADPTMGVIGSDFRGPQEIGSAKFQRASNNIAIPDWIEFWYPNKQPNDHRQVVYFKRTLTGVITGKLTRNWTEKFTDNQGNVRLISGTYDLSDEPHIANITGTFPDRDLNIDIEPFADYMYLIKDSHKPEKSLEVAMKDLKDDDHDPCTDPFFKVESEIHAGNDGNESLRASLQPRVGKQIAVYGPWIYDIGHCDHPEIHPAEQIWWTEVAPDAKVYHLNVVADASKRFLWRSQMDDGTKLHPWGAPPITGVFAIAFEVPIDTLRADVGVGRLFDVTDVSSWNVAPVPGSNQVYNLVYAGKILVSFTPHNEAFKVSYEAVGLRPGTTNVVQGFLVIETTVGSIKQIATKVDYLGVSVPIPEGIDPDQIDEWFEQQVFEKKDGHYLFTVKQTDITTGGLRTR